VRFISSSTWRVASGCLSAWASYSAAAAADSPSTSGALTGFDDKVVGVCARGMTVREIQGFLARTLEPLYPVVFLDAPRW
jgi:hypothetical protein